MPIPDRKIVLTMLRQVEEAKKKSIEERDAKRQLMNNLGKK